MAAGLLHNFFCSYLVTFLKHWNTNIQMADGRGRQGDRPAAERVNIYLPQNVHVIAFLMFEH